MKILHLPIQKILKIHKYNLLLSVRKQCFPFPLKYTCIYLYLLSLHICMYSVSVSLAYPSVKWSTCISLCSTCFFLSCGRVWKMRVRTVNWPSRFRPFWPYVYVPLPHLYHFSPAESAALGVLPTGGPITPLLTEVHQSLLGPSVTWSVLFTLRNLWTWYAPLPACYWSVTLRVHT